MSIKCPRHKCAARKAATTIPLSTSRICWKRPTETFLVCDIHGLFSCRSSSTSESSTNETRGPAADDCTTLQRDGTNLFQCCNRLQVSCNGNVGHLIMTTGSGTQNRIVIFVRLLLCPASPHTHPSATDLGPWTVSHVPPTVVFSSRCTQALPTN